MRGAAQRAAAGQPGLERAIRFGVRRDVGIEEVIAGTEQESLSTHRVWNLAPAVVAERDQFTHCERLFPAHAQLGC